ncbi:MAG: acyl-CoA dehydrogenase family protein [Gemmataceae bacterium]
MSSGADRPTACPVAKNGGNAASRTRVLIMAPRSNRVIVWTVVCLASLHGLASAQEKPRAGQPAATDRQHPSHALEILQRAHGAGDSPFVLQSELDPLIREGGGGACPSAAGIDALQALRVMAGSDPLKNPHKAVLETFAERTDLLDGRLSNDQFVGLLRRYQRHLPKSEVRVGVKSAPNSGYRAHTKTWPESSGPDLALGPRSLRVVSYTVSEANGQVIGRHFVLLKGVSNGELTVVDPDGPGKDRRYLLEFKPGESGPKARALLVNPPDLPRRHPLTYEINTVFTVTLADAATPPAAPDATASVAVVTRKVDETALALRGTPEFLDPRAWRKRSAAFGLPGLDLPKEYGGSGWPASKVIEVFRRAGYHNLNFRDIVGGAHVRPLLSTPRPELDAVVRQVARGEGYVAIAITEPEAGSDVPSIRSSSKKVAGGYRLTGRKLYNARLDQATHVVLFVQGTTGRPGR